MAVPMAVASGGQRIEAGTAVPLFRANPIGSNPESTVQPQQYAVSPDGQRFLVNTTRSDVPDHRYPELESNPQ